MKLNRLKINQMVDRGEVNIGGRRTGGSGGGGGGGVSSTWVDENYVSKKFFARLFTINGTTTEGGVTTDVVVEPNDLDTNITSIQAMFGLWTEEYLSALGQGSGGGGGGVSSLYMMTDVKPNNDASPSRVFGLNGTSSDNGKVLTYSTTYGKWIAAEASGGGGGSVTSITMSVPSGFKVSGADQQTITSIGTFELTFGGSITKNYVLAAPSSAAGAPSWRALVADDIPDLSNTYAAKSDVTTLQGYFDSSGNAKSALKLTTVSKSAWGQTYWTSGGVPTDIKGSITDDYFQLASHPTNPYLLFGPVNTSSWKIQLANNFLYFGVGTSTSLRINDSGNVGIGGQVNMSYILNITGAVYMSSKLDVYGIATVGNLKSNGYVTALAAASSSDERMKNIIEHFAISVEDIAAAPIVKFTWKFGEDKAVHAGSIAQYWHKKLPESVLEVDGFLSLEYGVLALLSAISLAREVVNLKSRVARIEKELLN